MSMLRYPLVFAHANGFTGASYRTLLSPLAAHFELHPLDRLAHDPAFPVGRNWLALRQEYLAAIEPLATPVVAVGHSMGGVLSIMAASKSPQRFRAVVALDPPLLLGRDAWMLKLAKFAGVVDRVTPAGKALRRREIWPSREAMATSLRRRALFHRFTDTAMDDYVTGATQIDENGAAKLVFAPQTEAAVFRHLPDHLASVLRKIKVPLTIIAGMDSDLLTPPRRRTLERLGVRVRCVDGGHMFPFEHPEATRQAIRTAVDDMLRMSA